MQIGRSHRQQRTMFNTRQSLFNPAVFVSAKNEARAHSKISTGRNGMMRVTEDVALCLKKHQKDVKEKQNPSTNEHRAKC